MARGKLISSGGEEYQVEFDLTEFANLRKDPATGTPASGKHTFELTVKNGSAIPDGDFELHSEGGSPSRKVVKSGKRWDVV